MICHAPNRLPRFKHDQKATKKARLNTIQISTLVDRLYCPSGFGTNLGVILDMFSKNCYIITMMFSGARQMVPELKSSCYVFNFQHPHANNCS